MKREALNLQMEWKFAERREKKMRSYLNKKKKVKNI